MKEVVKYSTAMLAKEKGFNKEIDCHYRLGEYDAERQVFDRENFIAPKNSKIIDWDACSAPTQEVLIKWLKKKHNIKVDISDSSENAIELALKSALELIKK